MGMGGRSFYFLIGLTFWVAAFILWTGHSMFMEMVKPSGEKADFSLAPVVLLFPNCPGFAKRRLHLAKAMTLGAMMGAQVILQPDETWQVYDMKSMLNISRAAFRDFRCSPRPSKPSKVQDFWCGSVQLAPSGLIYGRLQLALKDREVISPAFPNDPNSLHEDLRRLGDQLAQPGSRTVLNASCAQLDEISVVEPGAVWNLFWTMFDALSFSAPIHTAAAKAKAMLAQRSGEAKRKAKDFGFSRSSGAENAYNVLHLRAEPDWWQQCKATNCFNNTFQLADVLISEGISPREPLYLATGLSAEALASFRAKSKAKSGKRSENLFRLYTIITADMLSEQKTVAVPAGLSAKTFWTAVNYVLGRDANTFIGNSASYFSSLLLLTRRRGPGGGSPSVHYNGGTVRLQETGDLRPKADLAIQTFRRPMKWVFCAQPNATSREATRMFMNMTKVAVKSALAKTSLVPVAVTTADPMSEFAIFLVSLGVRVLYHTPFWSKHIQSMVKRWPKAKDGSRFAHNLKKRSHLLYNVEAMIGTFLRIDVPILGILDELVLYTDTDVLFLGDVGWSDLFPQKDKQAMKTNDFARGVQSVARPGETGMPRYFSMSSEASRDINKIDWNAGVILLNMRNLRDSYPSFLDFILKSEDITWEVGPGDQGAYQTFYRDGKTFLANFLPMRLNWKSYWPLDDSALIVHFHGPKCETDILPYLRDGTIKFNLFHGILLKCAGEGGCKTMCEQYSQYLD